ncbi:MAG: hypothetical protein HC860_17025 [Alkalinema sp. RU_4_3]|nr:hypothetical protein [Alkalinema sp. RU_4_3]
MATPLHLVLIETSGNQSFIFSTNKLKENVGASEATYRVCSQWVLDAVSEITKTKTLWDDDADQLKNNLCNSKFNPPITATGSWVEVVVAASGKAILITRELDHAKKIIKAVTLRALKEAPGLDVCGAIEAFNWDGDIKLPEVSRRLHKKFEVVRSMRPGPELRFLRLPIVEDCRASGLPAATIESDADDRLVARSETTLKKRSWAKAALDDRLPKLLDKSFAFAKSADKILDDGLSAQWLAVIHADGNGLGQIFINLEEYLEDKTDRTYVNQFREFSLALDICTRKAFITALTVFPANKRKPLPLVPLVLGGDDLTVICDADYALAFTKKFLEKFEKETQGSEIISKIAAKAFDIKSGKLSACAGIAIVKPHFPFSAAYQLAEDLAKSAKDVKDIVKRGEQVIPCSAIDYHVLYDTHGIRREAIRDKLTLASPNNPTAESQASEAEASKTHLYNRPYVVSTVDEVMSMVGENPDLKQWLDRHHWSELDRRVKALLAQDDDDRRKLPNSQMHALREGLFMGKDGANAQYQLIRKRYDDQGITAIAATGDQESLFWAESLFWKTPVTEQTPVPVTVRYVTGFLDAMDVTDFWEKSDESTNNESPDEVQS